MKNYIYYLTCVLASTFFLISCGPSTQEYNNVCNENTKLLQKVDSLEKELENYKNSPEILYAEAQKYIEAQDIVRLSAINLEIQKYHPNSEEAKKIQVALNTIKKEIELAIKKEQEEKLKAVKKLKKEYDDVSGITWYYNPYFVHYDNTNHISLYIGQKGNSIWLRLKMSYEGDSWIFFENAYISYDGTTKEVLFDRYKDKKTDNNARVWEWIDVPVDDILLFHLKNMVSAKSSKMRLSGKYTHTHTLTANEIKGLKDIILAYDSLRNK